MCVRGRALIFCSLLSLSFQIETNILDIVCLFDFLVSHRHLQLPKDEEKQFADLVLKYGKFDPDLGGEKRKEEKRKGEGEKEEDRKLREKEKEREGRREEDGEKEREREAKEKDHHKYPHLHFHHILKGEHKKEG